MAKKIAKVVLLNEVSAAATHSGEQRAMSNEQRAVSDEPAHNSKLTAHNSMPEQYEGLEWNDIIDRLLERMKVYGEPRKGSRNNTLYKLAAEMMYLLDFNADHLLALLPKWGLNEEERRATICSALKNQGTEVPPMVQSVIQELKKGEEATIEELNPMPESLPKGMALIMSYFGVYGVCAVFAFLTIAGTLLTFCRAKYRDGELQKPLFFMALKGKFASGKSFINKLFEVLGAPLIKSDEQTAHEEQQYNYEEKHTKSRKEAQGRREFSYRTLPAKVSNTELVKRASQNHGQNLCLVCDDVATLIRQKGQRWNMDVDALLKGFDGNGRWGQAYVSPSSYSGNIELQLNVLYAGTENGIQKMIPPAEVENGLASRCLFVDMPDTSGMPVQKRNTNDKRLAQIREIGERLFEMGSYPACTEPFEVKLPRTNAALDKWDEERIEDYRQSGNEAIDALRKRSALIGFRAAMIARCLEGKESKAVVDFALWVANHAYLSQMAYCGSELQKSHEENCRLERKCARNIKKSRNTRILDSLPESFTKKDLQQARLKLGYDTTKECSYILTRWVAEGRCRKDGNVFYKL